MIDLMTRCIEAVRNEKACDRCRRLGLLTPYSVTTYPDSDERDGPSVRYCDDCTTNVVRAVAAVLLVEPTSYVPRGNVQFATCGEWVRAAFETQRRALEEPK